MTQLAVKSEVARLLEKITSPVVCDVFTQLPREDEIGLNAVISVAVSSSSEKRETLGFGIGMKRVQHTVECRLWWVSDDAQKGGRLFDTLVAIIQGIIRGYGAPGEAQSILDPETGEQSQILWLGESITTRIAPPELIGDSSSEVAFAATVGTIVVEQIQG